MFTYKDNQSYFMEQGNGVLIGHFLASRSDLFPEQSVQSIPDKL